MDKALNQPTVKIEDLNQSTKTKEDSILEQEAKEKQKQREEYSDAHLKPFEKVFFSKYLKIQ